MEMKFSNNVELAAKVADRAEELGFEYQPSRTSFIMDVTAADGENGNLPLDYHCWLNADNGQFMHDVFGITNYLNRQTGVLDGGFLPRCTFSQ